MGSGLDVWEIAQMLEDHGSADALVAASHLSPAQVRIAVAYRDAYPDEVTEAIAQNRGSLDDLRTLYPFIEVGGR